MIEVPRVTLGIATYNRDTYLAQAIDSCLNQSYGSLEVLVVVDGSTNPRIDQVLERYSGETRLRVHRHDRNRGIAAAYNTFVSHGHGELIAMLGDDDIALPDRVARQVAIFDQFPDTGVVHGDGTIIDAAGKQVGLWPSHDFSPSQLIHDFFFGHNHLVDPTRMVHRRVYEAIGGYDDHFPVANDLDFWLRAAPRFRFRHCPGGPLTAIRRHGENASDEVSGRAAEIADVEAILEAALDLLGPRTVVPEIDWAVLDPAQAEFDALRRLADGLEQRQLSLPGLAARLRARAQSLPRPRYAPRGGHASGRPQKLMITAFGWQDAGGGTTVPRLAAKELVRRGWDVTVFHAATRITESRIPYELLEWEEDGVRLIGVHNRPHGLFDLGQPLRELDDPPITAAFAAALDRLAPDVVHFHNLHNLGAALIDHAAVRGIPAYFTTHNYWLICPRAYLLTGQGTICPGPGDGNRCAACVGSHDQAAHRQRLESIRARAQSGLTRILAVSDAVARTLTSVGYDPLLVDVVRQSMPHAEEIWRTVGRERVPGPLRPGRLTVAFLGSAYPHKGPQILAQAAQLTRAELDVRIIGEISSHFAAEIHAIDQRGVVQLHGPFAASEIGDLLSDVDVAVLPSSWWDCAPLAAEECHAARVPLVVPRLGGLEEAVRHGVDGLLFEPLAADDLAAQLDRLATDAKLLSELQTNIRPPRGFASYIDELEAYYERGPSLVDAHDVDLPHEIDATAGAPESHSGAGLARVGAYEPQVRWQGDFESVTSLSIINSAVTSRFSFRCQRVSAAGTALDAPLGHTADVEVHHQWPPDFTVPAAGRLAVIVPWEFGSVPARWLPDIASNVDELWVPSEFVRRMYVNDGVSPDRVQVIPNGVDLDIFAPAEAARPGSGHGGPLRFLYVGGITRRKGPDILLEAWREAFGMRDDVVLVVKAAAAGGAYGEIPDALRQLARTDNPARIELIEEDLTASALADLYRSCDVFVHPYRGEGFGMPVLEAMASGLPIITTGGGPTDEFCPPDAAWRIRAARREMKPGDLGEFSSASTPWMLEPDREHLVELLRVAASADEHERAARGHAARLAAEKLSWEHVAALYERRLSALAGSVPRRGHPAPTPITLTEPVSLHVLATPAWRGEDHLPTLLATWAANTTPRTSACLYLLADADVAGSAEEIERHVTDAAADAGVDLDACADIDVLIQPFTAGRDESVHLAMDAYVPLHPACAGHVRLARSAGSVVLGPSSEELTELVRASQAPSYERG